MLCSGTILAGTALEIKARVFLRNENISLHMHLYFDAFIFKMADNKIIRIKRYTKHMHC